MPDPSSFYVGNAPAGASFAAPLVGLQLGQTIGQYPEDLFKGQQRARTTALQKPIVDPNTGQPSTDVGTISQELLKRGGAEYATQLLPFLYQQKFGEQVGQGLNNIDAGMNGGQQTAPPSRPNNGTAGPGNISSAPQRQAQQPGQPATGADQGGDTLRSVATEFSGGKDAMALISGAARQLRINPDAPLSPDQIAQVKGFLRQVAMPSGQGVASQDPNGNAAAALPVGGVSGSPAPQPAGVSPNAAVAGRFPQQQPNPTGATPVQTQSITPPGNPAAGQPPQAQPQAPAQQQPQGPQLAPGIDANTAKRYEQAGNQISTLAAQASAAKNPELATALKEKAQFYFDRAKQINEQIGKASEPTPEQKNAQASGSESPLDFEQKKEQNKDDVTRYGKQLSAIQGSASAANRMLQHIQFAEAAYSDPKFYSGSGEGLNLAYKKVVNALNPNNTDALPQEAFRKTMAASILNQVEQLKDDTASVGGGGRIFQSQIDLMEKAANNPENTVAANRLLTEISKRGALMSKQIASMANSYKGGHLDAAFSQKVDDYFTQHPMFTPEEMADIRRIAPQPAPAAVRTPEEAKAWVQSAGLKSGDAFKLHNGNIKYVP